MERFVVEILESGIDMSITINIIPVSDLKPRDSICQWGRTNDNESESLGSESLNHVVI